MSVYHTRYLNREEAIKEIRALYRNPEEMTDRELEALLFAIQGSEDAPNSTLENYIIK